MNSLVAIYDFELFPYALGDVLTWNVRTAMRCEELGYELVDVYVCLDEKYCSGIFQKDMVNSENYQLFFSELYTAFGTHPKLGNVFIFRDRKSLFERLIDLAKKDSNIAESIDEYLLVLEYSQKHKSRLDFISTIREKLDPIKDAIKAGLPKKAREIFYNLAMPAGKKVTEYFDKYIHSHAAINSFYEKNNRIPLLNKSLGCESDIEVFLENVLEKKKIVVFHLRLRRLDIGFGGESSYDRDSDFFEWYDFLNTVSRDYPEVIFVALGRLQEKPLELLKLPNVISLRSFGLGLGHELTLMRDSDLFIGSSSGFAAYANFTSIPYFITNMNNGACAAYNIPEGCKKLPFASSNQELIYEKESSELLMELVKRGLNLTIKKNEKELTEINLSREKNNKIVDVKNWRNAQHLFKNKSATTLRFNINDDYRDSETGFLLEPVLGRIELLNNKGFKKEAVNLLDRVQKNFPELCLRLEKYINLKSKIN